MCVHTNGNVYACTYGGDIYKQTAGVGAFNALSQINRIWSGITADVNNNVYACVGGGDGQLNLQPIEIRVYN